MRNIYLCIVLIVLSTTCWADGPDQASNSGSDSNPTVALETLTPVPTTSTTTTSPITIPSRYKSKFRSKPLECPERCSCSDNKINCSGKNLTTFSLSGYPNPGALLAIDLSNNKLTNLTKIFDTKLGNLQTLDLSYNPIGDLPDNAFKNAPFLSGLNLSDIGLKAMDDRVFSGLENLKTLHLTGNKGIQLGHKLLKSSQKLETLHLSGCSLLEVPVALRVTSSIKKLYLNGNNMTSLRQSDFINQTSMVHLEIRECPNLARVDERAFSGMYNLKNLVLSDNPKLNAISSEAFESAKPLHLDVIDLRNCNFSTISNLSAFSSLEYSTLALGDNSWRCDCNLKWLETLPIEKRFPMHCSSPYQFKDSDVWTALSMIECDTMDSNYGTIIVTGFLLFLFGLLVAVVVQKSNILNRLFWKDQYGTIYYTKASFPQEANLEV